MPGSLDPSPSPMTSPKIKRKQSAALKGKQPILYPFRNVFLFVFTSYYADYL
uniref:MIP07196p n=1 Tax=Drosophila melanogaster TaxID=7227 RepID=C0PV16_DROME|nr:MIP07196p [Drosophila melanogaster]